MDGVGFVKLTLAFGFTVMQVKNHTEMKGEKACFTMYVLLTDTTVVLSDIISRAENNDFRIIYIDSPIYHFICTIFIESVIKTEILILQIFGQIYF